MAYFLQHIFAFPASLCNLQTAYHHSFYWTVLCGIDGSDYKVSLINDPVMTCQNFIICNTITCHTLLYILLLEIFYY